MGPSDAAEESFVQALDLTEEYLAAQEAISSALRAGWLALAQARYALGASRVSQLAHPANMAASTRLRLPAEEGGDLELVIALPQPATAAGAAAHGGASTSSRGSGKAAEEFAGTARAAPVAAAAPAAAAAAPAADSDTDDAELEDEIRQLNLAPQRPGSSTPAGTQPGSSIGAAAAAAAGAGLPPLGHGSDSIVAQLAAKYCCSTDSSASAGATEQQEEEEQQPPQRPLGWYAGGLPPPSLRDAEQHFAEALRGVMAAANVQRRLRRELLAFRAAAGAAAAGAAGAGVGAAGACGSAAAAVTATSG